MTWMIIAIVLLAAFGPLLWLVPSRRDRRLAALRQAGRQEGLMVELRHIPKTNPAAEDRVSAGGVIRDPTVECAAYSHTFVGRLTRLPIFRLLRASGAVEGPRDGWVFDPAAEAANPYWQRLWPCFEAIFDQLPEDVIGVELEPRLVRLFWLEGPASQVEQVGAIAGQLRTLEGRLMALENDIETEIADEDS